MIFDGHNDVLLKLFNSRENRVESFLSGDEGHIDLPKARLGGFGGGMFAIYVPSPEARDRDAIQRLMQQPEYDVPEPAQVPRAQALDVVMEQAAILWQLHEAGALRVCTTTADIRECLAEGTIAAVMHLEGAEAIDADLNALQVLYRAGLRSLGPVWSRSTIFGNGVPFRFPSTPDTGPGLTEAGKDLVRECNRLGILLDMSHLNEAGFWGVVETSTAPIVATHSNAHVLSRHSRNLTDDQLDAIRESDGMVGLNFAVAFLRDDGQQNADTPVDTMIRHLDHLIARLGEDRVGLGSDFDGAKIPDAIGNAKGLTVLRQAMRNHGYGEELIAKICHANWLRVLEKTWNA